SGAGREHDLLTGTPSKGGGALFDAEDLIEVYARAHGLAARPEDNAGSSNEGDAESRDDEGDGTPAPPASTMASGYRANHDRFPGAVPLYTHTAVRAPADAATELPAGAIDAADCAFFVRVAALDPPELHVAGRGPGFDVELRRAPSGAQLDRIF